MGTFHCSCFPTPVPHSIPNPANTHTQRKRSILFIWWLSDVVAIGVPTLRHSGEIPDSSCWGQWVSSFTRVCAYYGAWLLSSLGTTICSWMNFISNHRGLKQPGHTSPSWAQKIKKKDPPILTKTIMRILGLRGQWVCSTVKMTLGVGLSIFPSSTWQRWQEKSSRLGSATLCKWWDINL